MPKSPHQFAACNTDDDLPPANSFLSGLNLHIDLSTVYAATGNVLVPYTLPAGVNHVVGSCDDGQGGSIDFVANSAGNHQLTRYSPSVNTRTLLLQWSGLNLSFLKPVLGAGVLDGLLVYLDAGGVLRSVNVIRAAAGQYTPTLLASDPLALHLVKPAPQVVPVATRETNASTTDPRTALNRVADFAFQFAFQYDYPDDERTPLGPFSAVLPAKVVLPVPGAPGIPTPDDRNFIRVAYPASALAPGNFVKAVRLLVRRGSDAAWQVAGEMVKDAPFDFYGTTTGEVLTTAAADKLFESVPISAEAMVLADSRIMEGNCEEGYDLSWPLAALTAVAGPQPVVPGTEITVYRTDTHYTYTIEDPNGGAPSQGVGVRTRYFRQATGTYPDPASTYEELQFTQAAYYPLAPPVFLSYNTVFVDFTGDETNNGPDARVVTIATGTLGGTPAPPSEDVTLHERTNYPVGVAFYDELNRTAGAEAVRSLPVPAQDYDAPAPQNVRWTLDATVLPPVWATSYQLLLGPNTDTAFFLQYYADEVMQYRGDNADGSPMLDPLGTSSLTAATAVWVPLGRLLDTQRGYEFTAGDRLRFPEPPGRSFDFPILYQRGGYVAIAPATALLLPALSSQPLVELYTPAAALESALLYERGPRYAIANPGTPDRALTVLTGALLGDAAYYPLSNPSNAGSVPEAMLPDTSRFTNWLTPTRGRGIAVVKDGKRVRRTTLIRFSGVKVQGTKLNGLSQWEALSQYEEIPQEQGAITRMVVADQTQADGSILFVNQTLGAESLSLSRQQIQTGDGDVLLAISKQVIGGSNALRGGYGCTDPAAVTPYAGKVFYPCREREDVLRYDRGLVPLGEVYKFRNRLKALFRQYRNAALTGCYDPRRNEYWLTFQSVDELPGATVVFSDRPNHEAWVDQVSAIPEAGRAVGNELVSWQGGALWRHSPTAPSETFFGDKVPATLQFLVADPAPVSKRWMSAEVVAPTLWRINFVYTNTGQQSQTLPEWWRQREGVWVLYEGFRRAQNTPGYAGQPFLAMDAGDPLVSPRLIVSVAAPETPSPLSAIVVSWLPRSGSTLGV